MKKGCLGVFFAAIILAGCAVLSSAFAGEQDQGQPAVPTEPLPIKGSKKTVMFPHKPHEKIECVQCHHKVDGKASFQKCSAPGCHFDLEARKGQDSLYFVIHSKSAELKHTSCLSCHAKVVEEKPDLKKAMTGCTQSKCHPGSSAKEG